MNLVSRQLCVLTAFFCGYLPSFPCMAQCNSGLTPPSCCLGSMLSFNDNLNPGDNRFFIGSNSLFGINFNGGTLVVYGNLTITSMNFNVGNIIIASGGTLTISTGSDINLNGNTSITVYGTLNVNSNLQLQNSSNFVVIQSGGVLNMSSNQFKLNGSSNQLVNNGTINMNSLYIDSGTVCTGDGSSLNTSSLTNNYANSFLTPSGRGCIHIGGSAILNQPLSSTDNTVIALSGGASVTGSWGTTSVFSPYPDCTYALPIVLVSFTSTCTATGIRLEWETAAEINNSHFEIEQSSDGINFNKIATVAGNGTTPLRSKYSITVPSVSNKRIYFKLKQIDFDLGSKYFDAIASNCPISHRGIHPNPVQDRLNIFISKSHCTGCLYEITDASSLIMGFGKLTGESLDVSYLHPGLYILRLLLEDEILTLRFIKL